MPTCFAAGVNSCVAPNFFAYDGGSQCCDANTCNSAPLTVDSVCCDGGSDDCKEADGVTDASNCQDAGEDMS